MESAQWHRLYEALPIWGQNVACSLIGLRLRMNRYNKSFWNALSFLQESEWWPLERLQEYQNSELRLMMRHAFETVPYYREVFDSLRMKPSDIRNVNDLEKLPVLDKITVREKFADLRSRAWPLKQCVTNQTGGTTGTALKLLSDPANEPWQWAVWWRHRQRFGLDVNDSYINFAGRYVVPLSNMKPPVWRRNLPLHQTYVSVHHLTQQNLPALVDYLQHRKVDYYSGYPSGIYVLASYLRDHSIRLNYPPRITSTGAETLLPHQRQLIEEALNTEICDQYGASEHCGNVSECEKHSYHIDMEFGIVEFLPIPGLPDRFRKIVCTGLKNRAMPLIRYDIGDVAELSDMPCSCGRESPTIRSIDGRVESYIITPDGRQLGRLDFLFKNTPQIAEAQIIQEDINEVCVKVIPASGYSSETEHILTADMRSYLGDQIAIRIIRVNEIPREKNGKFRQIVSTVFKDRHENCGKHISL